MEICDLRSLAFHSMVERDGNENKQRKEME